MHGFWIQKVMVNNVVFDYTDNKNYHIIIIIINDVINIDVEINLMNINL